MKTFTTNLVYKVHLSLNKKLAVINDDKKWKVEKDIVIPEVETRQIQKIIVDIVTSAVQNYCNSKYFLNNITQQCNSIVVSEKSSTCLNAQPKLFM